MMNFERLNPDHVENAARLALAEYFEERNAVPVLPEGDYYNVFCKMIAELVDHNLGIVALENGNFVGFLTCYKPWENHFGTTLGTFSPVHAHGTFGGKKDR